MSGKTQEIKAEIDAIGAGGDGIALHAGKAVYAPKTAPGDVARLRLEKETSEGITARLLVIEQAASMRVEPPCPYFNRCGGCALQHVSTDFYHDWKIEKVKTALARVGLEPQVWEEPVFLPASTRRRTTMGAFKNGRDIRMGYNEPRSHNLLDIKACLILEPGLDAKAQALRAYLPRILPERKAVDIMLQLAGGALDMVLTGPWRMKGNVSLEQLETFAEMAEALDIARISVREKDFYTPEIVFTRKQIVKRFGAVNVTLPPGAFLQASAEGEKALCDIVAKYANGAARIADLFAGCGTFSGVLLESGAEVQAFDSARDAIAALDNSRHPKLRATHRDLFKSPLNAHELKDFEAAVFDPPRAGAKEQTAQLAQSGIPKIIAVSCNPASFARDARIMVDGGYIFQAARIVDQFVWSAHVEIAAVFTK